MGIQKFMWMPDHNDDVEWKPTKEKEQNNEIEK